jgi:uncharacterized protein YndB with AHSA1/START domain
MKARVSVVIHRSVADVFDHIADRRNETRWSPYAKRIEKVSPGPIGRGTQFHGSYKMFGDLDLEISEYERPRRVVYRASTPSVEYSMTFSTEAVGGDTTRLELLGEEKFKGVTTLIAPVMYLLRTPIFRSFVQGIKRALEEEARPAPSHGRSDTEKAGR